MAMNNLFKTHLVRLALTCLLSVTIAACTAKQSASPPRSVAISWGHNPAPHGNWMNITFNNFSTGTVTWECIEEGNTYGPYHITLTSGNETLSSNTCYDTQAGGTDYVKSDGETSNSIGTD